MKRIISIIVSLSILVVIYWKIDFRKLIPVFQNCDPVWMIASLAMVVPLTLFTSWRLQQLMPRSDSSSPSSSIPFHQEEDEDKEDEEEKKSRGLSFAEANKLILVASVLNLVLPSKMGDIAKAYFMRERGHMSGALSLALVVFEKACDMLSLLWWCVFGLIWIKLFNAQALTAFHLPPWADRLGIPGESLVFWMIALVVGGSLVLGMLLIGSRKFAEFFFVTGRRLLPAKIGGKLEKLHAAWNEMHGYFWKSKTQFAKVTITSVFIWFLHLLQIWMFILALRAWTPFLANLALSPLAILAGLLPLTFAGVGTRDAALVLFYKPYFAAPVAAALGLLCTARYLLPALGGLPFAGEYFQLFGKLKNQTPEPVSN